MWRSHISDSRAVNSRGTVMFSIIRTSSGVACRAEGLSDRSHADSAVSVASHRGAILFRWSPALEQVGAVSGQLS